MPVKKYEPKMFMGKEVPYGLPIISLRVITRILYDALWVRHVYTSTMKVAQAGSIITTQNIQLTHFYEPIKLPKQENIMKEFTKADLQKWSQS